MKALIVARVSTEDQKEAGNSLPAQIFRMEGYCERLGFIVAKTFSFDESAYKTKRDEFDKILEYIEATNEKVAICFDKVDRLSRNIFDKRVAVLYDKAVADEIELHFVSDNQVINNKMSAGDKFAFGMKLGLSKYYSDAISDNVKRAFEQKRRNGEWTGTPRIGYINAVDEHGKKTIVTDPERAHIVIKMFEMYGSGNYSYETIRIAVTDMGLRTREDNILSRSGIENLLKDSFYCGTAVSKIHGAFTHKYPRLIAKELFERCQEIREGKSRRIQKMLSKDFILKGLMTCANCGCTMTPERKKKKSGKVYTYYSCTNAKGNCKRIWTREEELLKPIYDVLGRFGSITEEVQNTLVDELRQSTEAEIVFHKTQINRIRNEQDKIKDKDNRLLEAFLERCITKDVYDTKHQEYHDRLQLLTLELEEHSKGDYDYQTTVATVVSLARRAMKIVESSEPNEKRAFINYLLQNPIVTGKQLSFQLRKPFDTVLELARITEKTNSLSATRPVWQGIVEDVRTIMQRQNGYIYIPDLSPQRQI